MSPSGRDLCARGDPGFEEDALFGHAPHTQRQEAPNDQDANPNPYANHHVDRPRHI